MLCCRRLICIGRGHQAEEQLVLCLIHQFQTSRKIQISELIEAYASFMILGRVTVQAVLVDDALNVSRRRGKPGCHLVSIERKRCQDECKQTDDEQQRFG